MSFVNSKIAKSCTKIALFGLFAVVVSPKAQAWEVDFSRRQVEFNKVKNEDRLPAAVKEDQSE